MNTKTFQVGKWKLELIENEGKYNVKAYNLKAKKEWLSLKYHYTFGKDEKRAQEWIMNFVKNQKDWEQTKIDRREARKGTHKTEITAIIKQALAAKYGYKNVSVGRGTGTASGWVHAHVNLQDPEPKCEMCPVSDFGRCYKCSQIRQDARNKVYRIAKDAVVAAGQSFGTWYGDDDYAKEEFNYDVSFAGEK